MAKFNKDGSVVLDNGQIVGLDQMLTLREMIEIHRLLLPPMWGFPYGGRSGGRDGGLQNVGQGLLNIKLYYADQIDDPINSDYAVGLTAPAVADSVNAGLKVRRFVKTEERGMAWPDRPLLIPKGATQIVFGFKSRPEDAQGSPATVQPVFYFRIIRAGVPVTAWSSGTLMTPFDFPAGSTVFREHSQSFSLGDLGVQVGDDLQFEFTRRPTVGTDTLTGIWNVFRVQAQVL